jgi:hypothetical protein
VRHKFRWWFVILQPKSNINQLQYQIMATLTNEQIEAKKQQLKQVTEEAENLKNELVEAGAIELSEDDLDKVAGGFKELFDKPKTPPVPNFNDNKPNPMAGGQPEFLSSPD